jgi:hypothetical protein
MLFHWLYSCLPIGCTSRLWQLTSQILSLGSVTAHVTTPLSPVRKALDNGATSLV